MSEVCFADIHQHVLWGIDDGPRMPEKMHAMLARAADSGIACIAATSHAYPEVEGFDMARYLDRLEEANVYCMQQGWPLRLVQGCEIHYCPRVPDLLAAGKLPTLGGTRHVLIEFSHAASLREIEQATNKIYQAGFLPVAAHVERCGCLNRSPGKAIDAHGELGLQFQMNCETILRPHGFFEKRFVQKMLESGCIDVFASDAHDTVLRPVEMRAAYEKLSRQNGDQALRMVQTAWKLLGLEAPC